MSRLGFGKSYRMLDISNRLHKGEELVKKDLAKEYGVNEKSIQRDIEDLRAFFGETSLTKETDIIYDQQKNCYFLVKNEREWLAKEEVLGITKVILESRAFSKKELNNIINKILAQTSPLDIKLIQEIVRGEQFYYEPLKHNKNVLPTIWDISELIYLKKVIKIKYRRADSELKEYELKPIAVMFSEFYFYLIAYNNDKEEKFPKTYRIDRITKIKATDETFGVFNHSEKFSEGEFRKRVSFMYSGELQTVKFEYKGLLEVIEDRFPTAKIISQKDDVYTISAEVYGDGIYMWLKSFGDKVKIL